MHGRGTRPADHPSAGRVVEVGTAGRGAGGGHRAAGQRDDLGGAGQVGGVLDADPPGDRVRPLVGEVLVGDDGEVAGAVHARGDAGQVGEQGGRALDRPALDQAGGVEDEVARVAGQQHRERAAGDPGGLAADLERLGDQRVALLDGQLPAAQPHDLGVVAPGGEDPVHLAQGREGRGHRVGGLRRVHAGATQVDAHRDPHDLLDPGPAGEGRHRGAHRFAWSMADCSEVM